jgi:preprotein translocase subunit YajC
MIILLQAANANIMNIVMMVGILGVFYFFMIRPQQQKAKEQKTYIENLKEGDKVVTIGGQHGKVVSVREKTVLLEVDSSKGVRAVFEKSAISKEASISLNA